MTNRTMTRGAPKLIVHYAPQPLPRPDGSYIAARTYCGVEDRSTSIPATTVAVYACDCLACLRAYHAMWGDGAKRIAEVKRSRARTAELLGGKS